MVSIYYILFYQDTYRDLHPPAIILAGCCVLIALVLSILLIVQHLRFYTNPDEQKWIIPVLLMVPIYATQSIISLSYSNLALACDILRSCYEAFALYSFGSYLIACLGGERRVVELLRHLSSKQLSEPLLEGAGKKQGLQHGSVYKFFRQPGLLGEELLTIEKFGLVQYMILKTLCAFLALILELFGVYGNGEFKWYYGYPYLAVVLNFSQMWALFCLVQFYNVTHEPLEPIKPLAKFISFKAIVFATWWQGVGIALLCALGLLPNEGKFQTGLQDFLICIEMAVAAVAHVFVFSAKPYQLLPVSEFGKVTTDATKTVVKIEEDNRSSGKPTLLQEKETQIEVPGTSVTESVKDVVVEGGQHVVEDVVLTINQTIEPVEKGLTKIQEKFHRVSTYGKEESELEVETRH